MDNNTLPPGFTALLELAEDMLDGLTDHEAEIGVKQWTAAALAPLRTAALDRKKAHNTANQAEDTTTSARKVANSNAKGFIATARLMLLPELGGTPGKAWENLGWPSGSTAVPDTIEGRKKLLDKLVPWLETNPAKEIPQRQFTGAKGRASLDALAGALGDLPEKVRNRVKTAADDTAAERTLRNGMSGLASELGSLLADDSPDWYYFGLVPPANPTPPAPAEHLAAHQAGPGTLVLGCDRGARAQKYLFFVQVIGRDPAPVAQPPVRDPQLTVENLPAGATVKITVQTSNAAGKSTLTGPVEMILS